MQSNSITPIQFADLCKSADAIQLRAISGNHACFSFEFIPERTSIIKETDESYTIFLRNTSGLLLLSFSHQEAIQATVQECDTEIRQLTGYTFSIDGVSYEFVLSKYAAENSAS